MVACLLQREYSQDIFDEVAQRSYRLLEQYAQYQHYLEYLDILTFNVSSEETPSQDIPSLDTIVYVWKLKVITRVHLFLFL